MFSKMTIKELESKIKEYRDLYYNQTPVITDLEFDNLVKTLQERDSNSLILKEIGAPVPAGRFKIKHSIPVGSIDSIKSIEEIYNKIDGDNVILTPKFDGMTVVLYYKDGLLVQAATRGDGENGLDIMHHVPYINSINPNFAINLTCIIRGEALLFDEDHKFLKYANRRNAVAGILNHKKASIVKSRKIQFMPFEIFTDKNLSKANRLELLHMLFPLKAPFEIVKKDNVAKEIENFISNNIVDPEQEFGSSIDFKTNLGKKYSIDGIIVSPSDKPSGKGDLAWKLFDKIQYKVSEVQYIEWNLTRTGNLFPTIIVSPTDLDGVKIQRITGESADFIIDNEIGTGAIVEIIRANGVIPKIQKVVKKGICEIPNTCPHCDKKLKKIGAFLFCHNSKCNYILYKKLVNSLQALEIDGLQEATIQLLISHLFDGKIPSLIEFIDKVLGTKIIHIGGIGEKKSNQIKQNLSAILNEIDLIKILVSTGIPNLGERMAEALLIKFSTIRNIFWNRNNKEAFVSIEMIGDKVYNGLQKGLAENEEVFMELFQNSINIPYDIPIIEEIKTKSFCLTGKMPEKRSEIIKKIEKKFGWKYTSSVNSKTNVLIIGENPGNKIKKAEKLGIEIITMEEI